MAVGSARHQWNTGGDVSGMLGSATLVPGAVVGAAKALVKPVAKSLSKAASAKKREEEAAQREETRQARRKESADEHDRRVGVRTTAAIKVINARTAAQSKAVAIKKADREHAAQQPVRVQTARNAAAELKPKKTKAAAAPRKRAQSPAVKQSFESAIGHAPTTKIPTVRDNTKTEVINLSGITPAQASED